MSSPLIIYLKQSAKFILRNPLSAVHLLQVYPRWARSMKPSASSMRDELPWMTFSAIDHLQHFVSPEMQVFEYGGGGSTLFFAKQVKSVITVEHDVDWGCRLEKHIAQLGHRNVALRRVPAMAPNDRLMDGDPADPDSYLSSDANFRGMSFEAYVRQIDEFPDHSFDIISIDGRARPACLKHALRKVKSDGLIVLDNSDRAEYRRAMTLPPPSFHRVDFEGPCPYSTTFTKTSVWAGRRGRK
jgi:hypothetical protein